jgi:hypothetical protein
MNEAVFLGVLLFVLGVIVWVQARPTVAPLPDEFARTFIETQRKMNHLFDEREQVTKIKIANMMEERELLQRKVWELELRIAVMVERLRVVGVDMDVEHTAAGRMAIYKQMVESLGESEIRTIVFGMGLDWESLSGDSVRDKTRELIINTERHGRMAELRRYCQETNPEVTWPAL